MPGHDKGLLMSDISGRTSRTPFAFYDRDSSCWKMSQGTFLSDSIEFLVILPTSGSMRSGRLFERPMLGPAIVEPACSLLLPTPTSAAGMGGNERRGGARGNELLLPGLVKTFRLLPTPTARDWKGENQRRDESCLPGAVRGLTTSQLSDATNTLPGGQLPLL